MPFIMKVIVSIITVIVLTIPILVFGMIFSPKLRAKFMNYQLKSSKYVMDENEELLKELNKKGANISREGIKISASAVKEGFSQDTCYCSSCGKSIDANSRFCKYCGEEQ